MIATPQVAVVAFCILILVAVHGRNIVLLFGVEVVFVQPDSNPATVVSKCEGGRFKMIQMYDVIWGKGAILSTCIQV